jgi:hypothetical protein
MASQGILAVSGDIQRGDIPASRPVIGEDLKNLREKLGLSVSEMCLVFSININQWSFYVSTKINPETGRMYCLDSIKDPALAVFMRFLDSNPRHCLLPPQRTVHHLLALLSSAGIFLTKKDLGLNLGREESSGYRWTELAGRTPQLLGRIIQTLEAAGAEGPDAIARAWGSWCALVGREAKARGVDDLQTSGRWPKPALTPAAE